VLTVLIDLKTKLGQALTSYLPLCVDVSLPLRHRLDALQKEFNLYGEQPSKQLDHSAIEGMNVNALQFEASVMNGPLINTRAGLYVYINSMVRCVAPLFLPDTDFVLACGTSVD
jgi:mediator of RNA polymerase II transcription subunit 5